MRRALATAALLASCGSRTGLHPPATDAATTTVDAPRSPPRCSVGLPPPVPDPREAVEGALCRFDGSGPRPDSVMLAVIEGDELQGVDGRGNVRTLHRFGAALPFVAAVSRPALVARGDHLAAAVAWVEQPVARGSRVQVERVVVRRDGSVLHRSATTLPYEAWGNDLRIRGNDCGVFAWGWQFGAARATFVATADGREWGPREGYLPFADPDGEGVFAAFAPAPGSERLGWFDPRTSRHTPARYESLRARTGYVAVGSDVAYAEADADGSVALERPGGAVERYATEFLRGVTDARIVASSPNGWVFVPGRFPDGVTLNVRTGERRHIVFELPDGLRVLGGVAPPAGYDRVAVTTSGELLLGLRDRSLGRVYRSRSGGFWSELSPPVGEASALDAVERNGTVLAWTTGLGLLRSDWDPAPPGVRRLDGRSVFVARGDGGEALPGAALDAYARRHRLSADGGCISYWTADGVATVRVATGATRGFRVRTATPRWGRVATWAGGDDASVPNVAE